MKLEKDEIWSVFVGAKTFNEFQSNILETIYIKPNVPGDIRAEIQLIEKLLVHSYFEYHFIDIALAQAVFTLEKCIKLKYSEVTANSTNRMSFSKLIDWGFDNDYFEIRNKDILTQLRNIRNGKVHSERNTLGGIAFLKKVYTVFYLINDLYEDVTLRRDRKYTSGKLQVALNDLLENGGIMCYRGKRTIIFKADVVFINNKFHRSIITIVIWPIFDPNIYKNDKHFKPYSLEIELKDWDMQSDYLKGVNNHDGAEITISTINDEVNNKRFSIWSKEFRSLKDFSLINYLTYDLEDNFYVALGKFHAIEDL